MKIKCFSFDKTLKGYQYRSFCDSFFNDPSVNANVQVSVPSHVMDKSIQSLACIIICVRSPQRVENGALLI